MWIWVEGRNVSLQKKLKTRFGCLGNEMPDHIFGRIVDESGAESSEIKYLEFFKREASQRIVPVANHACPINFQTSLFFYSCFALSISKEFMKNFQKSSIRIGKHIVKR
jgi:hypothetical protein